MIDRDGTSAANMDRQENQMTPRKQTVSVVFAQLSTHPRQDQEPSEKV